MRRRERVHGCFWETIWSPFSFQNPQNYFGVTPRAPKVSKKGFEKNDAKMKRKKGSQGGNKLPKRLPKGCVSPLVVFFGDFQKQGFPLRITMILTAGQSEKWKKIEQQ